MKPLQRFSIHKFVSEIHNYNHSQLGQSLLMFGDSSGAIVCCPPTRNFAMSLSIGLINSSVLWAPIQSLENIDLNNPDVHYQWLGTKRCLQLIPERFIPKGLKEIRIIAIERLHALSVLDMIAKQAQVSAFSEFHNDMFVSTIGIELAKCIPDKNIYTEIIQEWASLQDVPVEIAYKELLLKYEDIALTCVRNDAIYSKYTRLINQTSGLDNLQIVLDSAGYDFLKRNTL